MEMKLMTAAVRGISSRDGRGAYVDIGSTIKVIATHDYPIRAKGLFDAENCLSRSFKFIHPNYFFGFGTGDVLVLAANEINFRSAA
jgi:hypothetical protein